MPSINKVIVTKGNLRKCLADIKANKVISFDTETSGLNPFLPDMWVTSLGVGTRKYQWCIPLNHQKGPLLGKFKAQRRIVCKIHKAVKRKIKVAQGGKFDTKWLWRHYGLWFHCDFDTLLAHYNIDENDKHDLTHLAQKYCGMGDDYDIPLKEKHGFGDLEKHCEYLAKDVYYTRKLYFKFLRLLAEDEPTERIFWNITMPASWLYAKVEVRGIYCDQDILDEQTIYWTGKRDRLLAKLNKRHPSENSWKDKKTKTIKYGVNWNSPKQVAVVLFDEIGLPVVNETKTGARSTAENTMLHLSLTTGHKTPKLILKLRTAEKNLNTFLIPWKEQSIDSRIHPSFKVHGTVTGRPSCTDPNLQQVPRDKRMRPIFRAKPGYCLVSSDFSQIELRIVGELSRDAALLFAYQTGGDVHTKTVQTIFGILNPTKEERKKGKAINFGFIYGMWWKKFIEYAFEKYDQVFTDAEAKSIRNSFFKLFAGLPDWHKRQKRFANREGYVRNLIGRKRRLPAALKANRDGDCMEAERQAINAPVQSLGSDLTLTAAILIENTVEYCDVVGTVHDEILMEVPEEKLAVVAPQIKAIMEDYRLLKDTFGLEMSVPIIAEPAVGPWGDSKELVFDNGKMAA